MRNLMSRSLLLLSVIGSTLAVPAGAPLVAAAGPTTYLVTNTSGDPAVSGSLPWALTQANYATKGFDYIRFASPPNNTSLEIVLTQPLWVNDAVDITVPFGSFGPAYSLRGANLAYLIILQSDPSRGVTSSSSTISGFGLTGFTDAAIITTPAAQGTFIQNNWIGYAPSPVNSGHLFGNVEIVPPGTLADGIEINSSYNTVRLNRFGAIDFGVILGGTSYPGNIVKTNSIQRNMMSMYGTMTGDGIFLYDGAQENFIGPLNDIFLLDGVGVELIRASNKLNVIFDNDITVAFAGIAIGGGAVGNAVGGPFGGNRINSETGLVLGFGAGNAAYNTWVEGNKFTVGTTNPDVSFGALIQGGSTGNFLGRNGFLGMTVGVYVGDTVARGTGRNAINSNRFGASIGGCEWWSTQYTLYFSYSNYNFAQDNGGTNPYYFQYKSKGNAISMRQICTSLSVDAANDPRTERTDAVVPTPAKVFGTRLPT